MKTIKVKLFSFVLIAFLLFLSVLFYIVNDFNSAVNYTLLKGLFILLIFISLCFFFITWRYSFFRGQYLRFSYIFLIGFFIVNFQRYFDLIFGYIDSSDTFVFVSPTTINKGFITSMLGCFSFYLGYVYLTPKHSKLSRNSYTFIRNSFVLRKLVAALFSISVVLFIILNGETYLYGVYSQEYLESRSGTFSAYSEVLLRSLMISYFVAVILDEKFCTSNSLVSFIRNNNVLFNFSLFVYLSFVFVFGDRGPLITAFLMYFFTYLIKSRNKISVFTVLLLFITSLFLLNVIKSYRGMDKNIAFSNRLVEAIGVSQNEVSSVSPSTVELANSVRCMHQVLTTVPSVDPFFYGSFQIRDILATIPFSGRFTSLFLNNDFKFQSSANYITFISQGRFYTYGEGTSLLADLYLSFGIWGIIVGMCLFGMFIKKCEYEIFDIANPALNPLYAIFTLVLIGSIIYISRASYFGQLKYFVFTYIELYILTVLFRSKIKSNV